MFTCCDRFSKQGFTEILALIENRLIDPDQGRYPLPPLFQLFMFLRFAATGSFQEVIGDNVYLDCAKSTVSKYIPRVARALATVRSNFIKFQPTADTIQNFRDIAGFPDIVGAIDCT